MDRQRFRSWRRKAIPKLKQSFHLYNLCILSLLPLSLCCLTNIAQPTTTSPLPIINHNPTQVLTINNKFLHINQKAEKSATFSTLDFSQKAVNNQVEAAECNRLQLWQSVSKNADNPLVTATVPSLTPASDGEAADTIFEVLQSRMNPPMKVCYVAAFESSPSPSLARRHVAMSNFIICFTSTLPTVGNLPSTRFNIPQSQLGFPKAHFKTLLFKSTLLSLSSPIKKQTHNPFKLGDMRTLNRPRHVWVGLTSSDPVLEEQPTHISFAYMYEHKSICNTGEFGDNLVACSIVQASLSACTTTGNQVFFSHPFACNIFFTCSTSLNNNTSYINMKIVAWNCQGLGPKKTRNHLRNIVRTHNPDFVFLSETKNKKEKVEKYIKQYRFPNHWIQDPIGLSGGLTIMWKDGLECEVIYNTRNLAHLIIGNAEAKNEWLLTCMYASNDPEEKHSQWEFIKELGLAVDLPWAIIGDLNFVFNLEEKWGGKQATSSDAALITNIIEGIGLSDFKAIGPTHTWSNRRSGSAHIRERLDRVLINALGTLAFPDAKLQNLNAVGSDHSPLLFTTSLADLKRKRTFKFFKCWFESPSCKELIAKTWSKEITGSKAFQLIKNLKNLRASLSEWNHHVFGNIQNQIERSQKTLTDLNSQPIDESIAARISEVEKELESWYEIEEQYWHQKSRENMDLYGDRNTQYFHAMVNYRKRTNSIDALMNQKGEWIKDPDQLATLITDHFKDISKSTTPNDYNGVLEMLSPCITSQDNENLLRIPSELEIKDILDKMGPWKSPGPDGFQPGVYKQCWDIMGNDLVNMVQSFFESSYLLKEMNQTHLALIPKVNNPQTPADFRPIGLCNVSYKIISKLMANRMKPLLEKIISPFQNAFIPGRNINDNIVISHELIHTMKKKKGKHGFIGLKLDMSKAFDRIEWCFLIDAMRKLGFSEKWCHMISQCISTPSISALLNGTPCETFKPERGLRQGDPLSPYLFIICMDVFSRMLTYGEQQDKIHGIRVASRSIPISHLFFADDCLIYTRANDKEVRNLMDIISQFSKVSGQSINFAKSAAFFSPNLNNRQCYDLAQTLGVKRMDIKDKYLGVPMFLTKSKVKSFEPLMERFDYRLAKWKGNLLSNAGKSIMIQNVMGSMSVYQMSSFMIPRKITDKMEESQRRFWWGIKDEKRGVYLKDWNSLCKPKKFGGLGFKNLAKFNLALVSKLAWRLLSEPDKPWAQIVKDKYFSSSSPLQSIYTQSGSWIWNGLKQGIEVIKNHCIWKVGNGKNISIWFDRWIPCLNLPLIHYMDIPSHACHLHTVDQLLNEGSHNWNMELLEQLFSPEVVMDISSITVSLNNKDMLRWELTKSGQITVKSCYNLLLAETMNRPTNSDNNLSDFKWLKIWHMNVPPRVSLFIWKCLSNALPIGDRLKHIKNVESLCPLCKKEDETLEHLFMTCDYAKTVWFSPTISYNISHVSHMNFSEWCKSWYEEKSTFGTMDLNLADLFSCVTWYIWKARCNLIFQGKKTNPEELVKQVFNCLCSYTAAQAKQYNRQKTPKEELHNIANDTIRIRMDASWIDKFSNAGAGVIASSNQRNFIGAASFCIKAVNSEHAECQALKEAVTWAKEKGFKKILVEGDNKDIMNYMGGRKSNISWRFVNLLDDVISLLRTHFVQFNCNHIPRRLNDLADAIAKRARLTDVHEEWKFPPPFILEKLCNVQAIS